METRAPFIVVGGVLVAAIVAAFGFVYWLHNSAGIGPRAAYHVQFDGPVPGLLVVMAVSAQIAAGAAWLPVVRRKIGSAATSRSAPSRK